MNPGSEVSGGKMRERFDGFDGRSLGKIVDRFIDFQLFQRRLFGGERFSRRFIGAVSCQPDAVANGEEVIVGWNQIDCAFSDAEETVLLVVTNANDNTQQ